MQLCIAVVCEGPGDFRTISQIVYRLLRDHGALQAGASNTGVSWFGSPKSPMEQPYFKWSSIKKEAMRIPTFGFHNQSGFAREAQRALGYVAQASFSKKSATSLVIMLRDSDGEPKERRDGLEAARSDYTGGARISIGDVAQVAIGVAHPCREAWILNCFAPDAQEKLVLDVERRKLGFDPCMEPHRLNDKQSGALRNIKRVADLLTGGDHDREAVCMHCLTVDQMRAVGGDTGLADFLEDLKDKLSRSCA